METVQGVHALGNEGRKPGEEECDKGNPEGTKEAGEAKANGASGVATKDGADDDPREGDPEEGALGRVGEPDGNDDKRKGGNEFDEVPCTRGFLAWSEDVRRKGSSTEHR